jgi:hypothetical protein
MRIFLIIITSFLSYFTSAQPVNNKDCNCSRSKYTTEGSALHKIFHFSNGKTVAICGYKDNDATFSEFVLYDCLANSTIRFYNAAERCRIRFANDTLTIENIEPLAIGSGYRFSDAIWLTEQYYFKNNVPQVQQSINKTWFYTPAQVQSALSAFEHTTWKTQIGSSEAEDENMMNLAGRLMIAAISGDIQAKQYFIEFKDRFKPDGAYAEWYDTMEKMIKTAEEIKGNSTGH